MVPERYGQTDRRTDRRHAISSPRSALASRGKNETAWHETVNVTLLLFCRAYGVKPKVHYASRSETCSLASLILASEQVVSFSPKSIMLAKSEDLFACMNLIDLT